MRALRRLRNFIRYLPSEWTLHLGHERAPDFSMEGTREMTMHDMEQAVPSLFVRN